MKNIFILSSLFPAISGFLYPEFLHENLSMIDEITYDIF